MNKLRGLIIVASVIALFLALFFFVQFAGFLFDIQQKYADSPTWLIALYIGGVVVISLLGLFLIYKLSRFGSAPIKASQEKPREVIDDESFQEKIKELKSKGAETHSIESDWKNLLDIREKEAVSIAIFGEINAGKSSLVKTLTGDHLDISAKGGETQHINEYAFQYQQRHYQLIDMPGLNEMTEQGRLTEKSVREKAIKSHLIVWVMDEEMTQSAAEHYRFLEKFNKPIIIAINKADYYSPQEQEQMATRINQRCQEQFHVEFPIVWVSASTQKMVERHYEDGRVESQEVTVSGEVSSLVEVIEAMTFDRLTLDNRLSDSYFHALEITMNESLSIARQEKAEAITKSYSQKAIFAGMAAVGPGTDIILQGYLGMGMAKSLCQVYDVDVKAVDLEGTLSMLNEKMKKELAVILALVGNVLKAFPGVGTVAGGAVHAVAYGLIFESVGRAMTACLEKYHGMDRQLLANELEEQINDNMEARAIRLAKSIIFKQ